jgi:tRNA 2-thiouridine synthesizing protein A
VGFGLPELTVPIQIDTSGMRCPLPVLALGNATTKIVTGTLVEITGDCPTFEADVRRFCIRREKTVVSVRGKAPQLTIQIRF